MSKNTVIKVQGHDINIEEINDKSYISLTDIVSALDGGRMVIGNWLSRKDTLEYLALWESLHNPDFNFTEFGEITKDAGRNSFTMSPKKWIEGTKAIGIKSKYGGGTIAHKDIAMDFCSWLNPAFRLYLNKEFDRLKEIESSVHNVEWNIRRVLSKANYNLTTNAVKEFRIPNEGISKDREWIAYAEEGDVLNYAMFGCTAKTWREANPELAKQGMNIRDVASINELAVMSSMESMNSVMIRSGMSKVERAQELRNIAQQQLKAINHIDIEKSYRKMIDGKYTPLLDNPQSDKPMSFGEALKKIGNAGKPKSE